VGSNIGLRRDATFEVGEGAVDDRIALRAVPTVAEAEGFEACELVRRARGEMLRKIELIVCQNMNAETT